MFRRVYNIIASSIGGSKQGGYIPGEEQYQFNCPKCAEDNGGEPDGKYNMEVNFRLGKCHCWKCDFKGNVARMLKKFGADGASGEYISESRAVIESNMYRLDSFAELSGTLLEDEIRFPATFRTIGRIEDLRSRKLREFLAARGIGQDIVDRFRLGYTQWDGETRRDRCRLVIPSYDFNGNLNYWSGRDYTGYDKTPKYSNVKADRKNIVFNESLINWDGDIVLVEGVIDSIVAPNCIPLMGKQLYRDSEIYRTLNSRAGSKVIVCLDADTTVEETKRIYRMLDTGRLKGRVYYIRLEEEKDFGDIYRKYGPQGIAATIATARKFTEFELLT